MSPTRKANPQVVIEGKTAGQPSPTESRHNTPNDGSPSPAPTPLFPAIFNRVPPSPTESRDPGPRVPPYTKGGLGQDPPTESQQNNPQEPL